MILKTVLK